MPDSTPRVERLRGLRASSVRTVARLLSERGLSAIEVERGMDYAETMGAGTIYESFILAMSRVHFTDAQLSAGVRFHLG
jgi:superfamily II helicase